MNRDVFYLLSTTLDDNALELLGRSGLWREINKFGNDQYWWYLRTQHLFSVPISQRPGENWKEAYTYLQRAAESLERLPFEETYRNKLATSVLMELGYDPSEDGSSALLYAASEDLVDVVELLLSDPRVDPRVGENEALIYLVVHGRIDAVEKLLSDKRVDVNADDGRLLRYAVHTGNEELVRLLLSQDGIEPDLSFYEGGALGEAIENHDPKMVAILLASGRIDPGKSESYLLYSAVVEGDTSIVQMLLDDPRVDPTVDDNWILRDAIENGREVMVRLLLSDPRVAATWQQR